MTKRVTHRISEEDEPHPTRGPEEPVPPGFEVTEGDPPTGEGYYPDEPGEEKPEATSGEDEA